MSETQYTMILTTCASDEQAARIATALVEQKLAACVQASDITSTYRWKGTVQTEPEVRLSIKARRAEYEAIAALITAMHSYENPQILAIPILAGAPLYLDWIESETRRQV